MTDRRPRRRGLLPVATLRRSPAFLVVAAAPGDPAAHRAATRRSAPSRRRAPRPAPRRILVRRIEERRVIVRDRARAPAPAAAPRAGRAPRRGPR